MKEKFACPLCGKPLTEHEYLSITGRWGKLRELETEFQNKLKREVDKARRNERQKDCYDCFGKSLILWTSTALLSLGQNEPAAEGCRLNERR